MNGIIKVPTPANEPIFSFARGALREDIEQIGNIRGDLDEFITVCLKAMQGISDDLGL